MDLGLTDEQRQLVASFAQLLAKSSSTEQVRDAEPSGFDAALWTTLLETGAVLMGVDEEAGGWGASLVDLTLVAEQLGRAAASAPVVDTQVAARLLTAAGAGPVAEVLAGVLAGERLVTVAVRPAIAGTARLVPAGAVCDAAVVLDGDRLLVVTPQDGDRQLVENLASAPLADLRVGADAVELVAGPRAVELFESALDEWLVLTAAAVVGLGTAALELGCAYAVERIAFGSPIGAFQGIAHPFADDATHLDGARLLAQKAAWALDGERLRARELAAMAFAFASLAAESATYDALHAHGGYGFMLEYDVQLHYRRARGWPRTWGDAEAGYRRAADARYLTAVAELMDFSWDTTTEALRTDVRAFLAEHFTPELQQRLHASGDSHDAEFARALGERNWIAPEWERDGFEVLGVPGLHVLTEELTRVDAPVYAVSTAMMVAKVIEAVGSDELKAEILPKVVRGEVTIALGMTEPEAGSDVAAIQTKARADDGGWVIDGQKMFTTNAHLADYVFLLVRTDPASRRHHGLTTFLVPLDLPGIEVQPVRTVSGERTNITFYAEVRLEDRWRISEVGHGWQSLMLALQDEHSAPFSPHLARLLEEVERWAGEPGLDGVRPVERDDVRRRMARAATDLEVAQLLEARATWMETNHEVPVAEGPMSKLFSTEAVVRGAEDLTAMVGPDALRRHPDPTALAGGVIEHALRFSLGTTIYAGSSEIQRNIIAQRRCGLPRA